MGCFFCALPTRFSYEASKDQVSHLGKWQNKITMMLS